MPRFCEQGLEMASTLSDKGAEARIRAAYAWWRMQWHDADPYEAIQSAFGLAQESGQPMARLSVALSLASVERWRGNPGRTKDLLEGMVELLQAAFNIGLAAGASTVRGFALTEIGDYQAAMDLLKRMAEICEQNSIHIVRGQCLNAIGWLYSECLDYQTAYALNKLSLDCEHFQG